MTGRLLHAAFLRCYPPGTDRLPLGASIGRRLLTADDWLAIVGLVPAAYYSPTELPEGLSPINRAVFDDGIVVVADLAETHARPTSFSVWALSVSAVSPSSDPRLWGRGSAARALPGEGKAAA